MIDPETAARAIHLATEGALRLTEKEILVARGRSSGKTHKEIAAVLRCSASRVQQVADRVRLRVMRHDEMTAGAALDVEGRPIASLRLSARSERALKRIGAFTVGDAARLSAVDLMKEKSCGRKSLREIRAALADVGLYLRDQRCAWCRAAIPGHSAKTNHCDEVCWRDWLSAANTLDHAFRRMNVDQKRALVALAVATAETEKAVATPAEPCAASSPAPAPPSGPPMREQPWYLEALALKNGGPA